MSIDGAPEIEVALLATILTGTHPFSRYSAVGLTADDFCMVAHAEIWKVCEELDRKAMPCDIAVIAAAAARGEPSISADYLAQIMQGIDICSTPDVMVTELKRWAFTRRVKTAAMELATSTLHLTPDATETWLEGAARRLQDLFPKGRSTGSIGETMKAIVSRVLDHKGQVRRVLTGWEGFDKMTGGLRPGRLYIVTAETKSGKTSWATQAAWAAVAQRCPALMFSLEMTREEVVERIISQQARVTKAELEGGALEMGSMMKFRDFAKACLSNPEAMVIDDRGKPTMGAMRAAALVWSRLPATEAYRQGSECGVNGVILVDYIQLAGSTLRNASKEQQIAEVSEGLKALAKEVDMPIIALCQLNRVGQIRHSGQIEQDADVVVRLSFNETSVGDVRDGKLEIERNRHGAAGEIGMTFQGKYTMFQEA